MFTVIQIIQLAALVILLVALLVLFCAVDLMVDLSKKGQDISGKIIIKWLFISLFTGILSNGILSKGIRRS